MGLKNIEVEIEKLERFKPTEKSNKTPPIRVKFRALHIRVMEGLNENIEDIQLCVLKAAKLLKNSTNYKNIGIGNDLTDSQLTQQKQLIKTRNELNSALNGTEDYPHGIRGDRVVKVTKPTSNQNGNSS